MPPKGTHHTEEAKELLRQSHLGVKLSPEHRAKIIKSLTNRFKKGETAGSLNRAWKGGSRGYWPKVIKKRDNYTCRECGLQDAEVMQVDHVQPKSLYPELVNDPNNMVTLCANCHHRKSNREKHELRFPARSRSGYKGVFWDVRGHWRSVIRINGKNKLLGNFKTKESAAEAYNKAIIEAGITTAYLNPLPRNENSIDEAIKNAMQTSQ